ncbi:diguanylate cyclase [Blautia schinkii]|nr:diguanylate cyclase [Blautia schinkii]
MKTKKQLIIPTAVFLIISILLSGCYVLIARQTSVQNRERHRYIAANQSNIIRNSIDTVLARAYTLSSFINDTDGDTAFFDRQAAKIYDETIKVTGIPLKNIAVAPGGIVEKVYPAAGNEALIGFNFMDSSQKGNIEAISAYQKGELIITNPFDLVQGGSGMAGRLPVFLKSGEFWGLVTVTMDFEGLLKSINLSTLSNMGVDYKLWYKDDTGSQVVMDASENLPSHPVSYKFSITNLNWYLDVAPSGGWTDYVEAAVVFIVIIAVALLVALLLLNREQLTESNEKLRRLAHLDSLTSCYSRHYVNTILLNPRNGLWADPTAKYSLAIIDIDNFKSINDTYGHDIGDQAIIAIAKVLEDNSRHANGDCIIRHGGDEFIALFNDVTKDRFSQKLASIVNGAREVRFPEFPDMRLSVSIGGEFYENPDASLYYNMVRKADEKLYTAKENGRDQYIL